MSTALHRRPPPSPSKKSDTEESSLNSVKWNGNMVSCCYVLPQAIDGESLSRDLFEVKSNSIRCCDSRLNAPDEFKFTRVFTGKQDFSLQVYNTVIAKQVRQTLAGDSTVAMFCGPASLDIRSYLLSHVGMQGLLSHAASHLISACCPNGEKEGSVTFSWYATQNKILEAKDCGYRI